MVAVIITSVKPSGSTQASQAYDLLRVEVESQREEIYQLHKSLVEVDTWFKVWREFEATRKREMESLREAQLQSRPIVRGRVAPDPLPELKEVPPPPPNSPRTTPEKTRTPTGQETFLKVNELF